MDITGSNEIQLGAEGLGGICHVLKSTQVSQHGW